MNKHLFLRYVLGLMLCSSLALPCLGEDQELVELKQRIEKLEAELNEKVEVLAEAVESKAANQSAKTPVHIGGYGEMHYAALDADGEDIRELDFHRMVLFFGYSFSERIRFVTEFEIEHIIASSSSRGAVELEQVYVETDLKDNMHLQTGVMLMPVGIINETHEPPTFYGVERPVVETTIIPTTWWSGGVNFIHKMDNGIRYDIMLSEGLKTEDPSTDVNAEPFNLKSGKQKASFADAFDPAVTGRVTYSGISGLQLSAWAQYQPDLDQSAEDSYADAATLLGGHVIYTLGDFTGRALYARWDLAGDEAADAGKDLQDGAYMELAWRPLERWGFFARHSVWSLEENMDAAQSDFGASFFQHPNIVYKVHYQLQNDDAGNADGVSLGFGYHF